MDTVVVVLLAVTVLVPTVAAALAGQRAMRREAERLGLTRVPAKLPSYGGVGRKKPETVTVRVVVEDRRE